jgi:hypothetical protein
MATMNDKNRTWAQWRYFFKNRTEREFPRLETDPRYEQLPASLAKSLAVFQLGESGGGMVIKQARQSRLYGVDNHYGDAVQLFVAEEHRHANLLAMCVRMLNGSLIRSNWTAKLFVFARRLMGLRLKVLVLLAAEVVGICYYHLIATRLPDSKLKSLLSQIVDDERAHLEFHCAFLRGQVTTPLRRKIFIAAWRTVMIAAAIAVLIDHRSAIRDLNIDIGTVWGRWMTYSRLAERLVTESATPAAYRIPQMRRIADV